MSYKFSRDPLFSLHSDVYDLVFQHIPWRDLLASSEVSSHWFSAIGDSRGCMNKVKIKIGEHTSFHCQSNARINERRYRNFYGDCSQLNIKEVLKILEPSQRRWKIVHLLNANFEDEKFLSYLRHVECLEMAQVTCDHNVKEQQSGQFPQLTRLKIISCNGVLMKNLENCSSVRELIVATESVDISFRESFVKLLLNNKKLTTLMIFSPIHKILSPLQIRTSMQFKLKKLVIDSFQKNLSEEDRELSRNLITSQFESLEVVDLGNFWCGSEILEITFRMPLLKDFSCNVKEREENFDWNRIMLTVSESIQRLHIRNICRRESLIFYDKVFSSLPNLKVYKSKFLHFADLNILSQRCRKLEELYIERFNVTWLPSSNCLPQLRKFKCWDMNEGLVNFLISKGAKNSFEELILQQSEKS